jgi:hypothetical protein
MSPEFKNSKNIIQQQSPVVKFPINVPEDLLPHGEHDSSSKFVLIPLLHEERRREKIEAEIHYNGHCEARGSKCRWEARGAK